MSFLRFNEARFLDPATNVLIEYRWSDDHSDRLPSLASELVRLPVDVIVANQPAAQAAKAVTSMLVYSLALRSVDVLEA